MAGNPQIIVEYLAKTAGLEKGLKTADDKTKSFGSSVQRLGKAGIVAAGVAGFGALAATLKVGVGELAQAQKVSAQTAAVIKSTGGAAGVSAKQVSDLAGALMEKSGVDDEAIQSGENLLLTFTKVQDKAGKGNDIFTQATKTMLDMSVALGQDSTQSAIQLGKALNDPVKGMTALRKVGVSFTEQQTKQVAAMVKSGDTMGAQKLILAELNKEFGGSAEAVGKTLPGQINVLKESFSNLAGTMVGTLAPAFTRVTSFLTEHPALFKAIVVGVLALAAAMVVLNVAMAVNAAILAGVALPVLAIIAALAALIAIVVLVVKNWDTIRATAITVWNAVKTAVLDAVNAIMSAVSTAWNTVRSATTAAWNAVKGAVTTALNAVKSAIAAVIGWIRANWPLLLGVLAGPFGLAVALIIRHWAAIKSATVSAWNAVKGAISSAVGAIRSVISSGFSAIVGIVSGAIGRLVGAIRAGASGARAAAQSVVSAVKGVFGGAIGWLVGAGRAIMDGLAAGIRQAVGNAVAAVQSAAHSVIGAAAGVLHIRSPSRVFYSFGQDVIQGLADGIRDSSSKAEAAAAQASVRVIRAARGPLQAAAGTLGDLLTKAYQAKTGGTQTAAEQQLAALEAAHAEAQRQQALADAQAQVAAAQNAQELISAQQALAAAQYDIQVAALQAQAATERKELEGQQYLEQQQFDKKLAALEKYLNSAHVTAKGAKTRIAAFMTQFGLDMSKMGELLGPSLAAGITKSTDAAVKAAQKLAAAVTKAVKDGLKISSPSKVMRDEVGRNIVLGIAQGMTRYSGLIPSTMATLTPSVAGGATMLEAVGGPVEVRVFLGDQELRTMVRTEITSSNTGLARSLLAGSR